MKKKKRKKPGFFERLKYFGPKFSLTNLLPSPLPLNSHFFFSYLFLFTFTHFPFHLENLEKDILSEFFFFFNLPVTRVNRFDLMKILKLNLI